MRFSFYKIIKDPKTNILYLYLTFEESTIILIDFQSSENEVELNVTGDTVTEFQPSVEVPDVGLDTIILDCSTWSFIDSMGVKALISVSTGPWLTGKERMD